MTSRRSEAGERFTTMARKMKNKKDGEGESSCQPTRLQKKGEKKEDRKKKKVLVSWPPRGMSRSPLSMQKEPPGNELMDFYLGRVCGQTKKKRSLENTRP